jgi:hypothetical protein
MAELLPHLTLSAKLHISLLIVTYLASILLKFTPIRLAILHAAATAATLTLFPPANQIPPIALPIVWASSFCFAFIILSVTKVINAFQ